MPDAESNLRAAERVVSLLGEMGVPAVVIGAVALAAHRYVRHTEAWRCAKREQMMRITTDFVRDSEFDLHKITL